MTTPYDSPSTPHGDTLSVSVVAFDGILRHDWERLLEVTSAATPFTAWTFHQAWWDAYGAGAEPHYLLIGEKPIRGIVPLMIRPASNGSGREIHMAATYHADYATALVADADLDLVAEASIDHFAAQIAADSTCRAVDLRRMRATDAFLDRLCAVAGRRAAEARWTVLREQEDVCPTISLAADWHQQLDSLDKKARHEIRRKLRRAQAQGPLRLRFSRLDEETAERFIDLHQARWGADGLFAPTETGERSRRFLRRLVELEAAEGQSARLHLADVMVGERVIYMLAGFSDGTSCYFYNAGLDPASLELSPGVVGTALYLRDRIAKGYTRFDFLRGDEPYKYDWGATDEPLCRLLIRPGDAP